MGLVGIVPSIAVLFLPPHTAPGTLLQLPDDSLRLSALTGSDRLSDFRLRVGGGLAGVLLGGRRPNTRAGAPVKIDAPTVRTLAAIVLVAKRVVGCERASGSGSELLPSQQKILAG